MAYEIGRQALQREIELLDILQAATAAFRSNLSAEPLADFIASDWEGSFVKLRKLNEELMSDTDGDFEAALIGEGELLGSFLGVANAAGFADSWRELFQRDQEIAARLLEK